LNLPHGSAKEFFLKLLAAKKKGLSDGNR